MHGTIKEDADTVLSDRTAEPILSIKGVRLSSYFTSSLTTEIVSHGEVLYFPSQAQYKLHS